MTVPIQAELDKLRWKMIELFKQTFKDQTERTLIFREEGDFLVDQLGIRYDVNGTVVWDEMSWEQLACVAEHFSPVD
ncbi:MAG TPA: hypothetical protein VGN15_14005 [Ktedonobacteraceae bacterium]|jgi:hypothetical protein|nr:hypothetical protein [Ktedonobacteraceae bacterium]